MQIGKSMDWTSIDAVGFLSYSLPAAAETSTNPQRCASISLITSLVGAFQKKNKKQKKKNNNLSEIDADDASGKKEEENKQDERRKKLGDVRIHIEMHIISR